MPEECSVEDCPASKYSKGLCPRHYMQSWRASNSERQRLNQRAYKAANRERLNALAVARRAANVETEREKSRRRYQANKEAHKQRQRRWDERNKAALVAKAQRHIAHKRAAGGSLPTVEWLAILDVHRCCYYCGATGVRLEQEHMTPLVRGGHHSPINVVPACGPCNRRKHTLTAWEFCGG